MELVMWIPIVLFVAVAFAIIGVTKVIYDGRIRKLLIQTAASPELAAAVVAPVQNDPSRLSSLKWGLVIGGAGLALILNQFLPYDLDDPILTGNVLLFAAMGLLAFYAITGSRRPEGAGER